MTIQEKNEKIAGLFEKQKTILQTFERFADRYKDRPTPKNKILCIAMTFRTVMKLRMLHVEIQTIAAMPTNRFKKGGAAGVKIEYFDSNEKWEPIIDMRKYHKDDTV